MAELCILGSGYVGLVAAACFADIDHHVTCCDIDKARIEKLRQGIVPIFEPTLSELVGAGLKNGRLRFSDDIGTSLSQAEIIIIAVGTPSDKGGRINKTALMAAVEDIHGSARQGTAVVVKSTVTPGTCDEIAARLADKNISVISNPEFLREGFAVSDFMQPDRILIGVADNQSEALMRRLYGKLAEDYAFIVASRASAELAKYSANAILATRLSFINEIADLCAASGADWREVQKVLASDSRISSAYLQAGPGYGGSCLPKDTRALLHLAKDLGVNMTALQGALDSNEARKNTLIDKVKNYIEPRGKRIALLGLAFKADSDDVRESSALVLAKDLISAGADVIMHDPKAMENAAEILEGGQYADSIKQALQSADAAIIMTEWRDYAELSPKDFHVMKGKIVIDFRNLYDKQTMQKNGLDYYPNDASHDAKDNRKA